MANIFNEQIPVGVVVEAAYQVNRVAAEANAAWDAALLDHRRPGARARRLLARQEENNARNLEIGRWFSEHYRRGAAERGHEAVARQLRKQGVPLEIAKLILLGRAE